jgi:hypothetical protein
MLAALQVPHLNGIVVPATGKEQVFELIQAAAKVGANRK